MRNKSGITKAFGDILWFRRRNWLRYNLFCVLLLVFFVFSVVRSLLLSRLLSRVVVRGCSGFLSRLISRGISRFLSRVLSPFTSTLPLFREPRVPRTPKTRSRVGTRRETASARRRLFSWQGGFLVVFRLVIFYQRHFQGCRDGEDGGEEGRG